MACEGQPVGWGILGCGLIARDFASALLALPASESQIVACAARSELRAREFAELFPDVRSYGSYGALLGDPEVDVIYIATLPDTHEELIMAALQRGKHVLVEKPICLDSAGARRVVDFARSAGLFFMEGMWTRCFPATRKARELLRDGAIGDVVSVQADFGWPADPDPKGKHARCFLPTSGGVCMDVSMYPLAHVLLASGGVRPTRMATTGTTMESEGLCVDWSACSSMAGFPAPADPSLTASVMVTLRASTPEEAVFTGTKGTLRIHRPAHTPTRLTLTTAKSRTEMIEETFEFPLPEPAPGAVLPFNYPGSEGFVYQAEAVVDAVKRGLIECADWTHEDSVTTMQMVEAMREKVRKETCDAKRRRSTLCGGA